MLPQQGLGLLSDFLFLLYYTFLMLFWVIHMVINHVIGLLFHVSSLWLYIFYSNDYCISIFLFRANCIEFFLPNVFFLNDIPFETFTVWFKPDFMLPLKVWESNIQIAHTEGSNSEPSIWEGNWIYEKYIQGNWSSENPSDLPKE